MALRELVPAATVELPLKDGLATVLPMAWPALRRDDGSVLLGLQNDTASGDISRNLADTLQRALAAEPGTPVQGRRAPADSPRLQDLLDPKDPFEPVVHDGFAAALGPSRARRRSFWTLLRGCTRWTARTLAKVPISAGSFCMHGLTVPVWDLPSGVGAEDVEKPATEFAERLTTALASKAPLTADERRARDGLTNRQVTLS